MFKFVKKYIDGIVTSKVNSALEKFFNIDFYIQYEAGCEDLKIVKAHGEGDCCYDIKTAEDFEIRPMNRVCISNGFRIALPEHLECQVRSRSGLAAKNGLFVLNSPGTLDANFRGTVRTILFNTDTVPYTFKRGDKIAQIKFSIVPKVNPIVIEDITKIPSNRGENGFGSTGV